MTNAPQNGPIAARVTNCGSTFPAFDEPGPSSSVIIAGRSSCWSWPGRGPGGMKGARVSEENVDWGLDTSRVHRRHPDTSNGQRVSWNAPLG